MLCRVILGNMYEMAGTDTKAENKVLGTDYDSLLGISPSSGDLQADCISGCYTCFGNVFANLGV